MQRRYTKLPCERNYSKESRALGITPARSAHATPSVVVSHEKYFLSDANGSRMVGASRPHFIDLLAEARAGHHRVDAWGALVRNAEAAEQARVLPFKSRKSVSDPDDPHRKEAA